jgi:hypothetical protein
MKRIFTLALLVTLSGCKGSPTSLAPVGKRYAVQVEAGRTTAVKVVPGEGWKMNLQYPNRLQLRARPGGAEVVLGPDKAKVSEEAVVFAVTGRPGESFEGQVFAAICTSKTCIPVAAPVSWAVPSAETATR